MAKWKKSLTSAVMIQLALLGAHQTVSAEELKPEDTAILNEGIETTAEGQEVTESDVESAKAFADEKEAEANEARERVEDKSAEVAGTEGQIATLEQAEHENYTDEDVQKAKAEVETAETSLTEAGAELSDAEEQARDARLDEASAEVKQTRAKAALGVAEAELQVAEEAHAAHESDKQAHATVSQEIEDVEAEIQRAKSQEEDLKEDLKAGEARILEHEKAVDEKRGEITRVKEENVSAKAKVQDIENDLNAKNSEIKQVEVSLVQDGNHFYGLTSQASLDEDFANALLKWVETKDPEDLHKVHQAEYLAYQKGLTGDNFFVQLATHYGSESYAHNLEHVKQFQNSDLPLYHFNELPEEEMMKLNIFGAEVLSNLRVQLGYTPVSANKNVMKFAKDVADIYERDNQDKYRGHYEKGITEVAAKYGLEDGGNMYENLMTRMAVMWRDNHSDKIYNNVKLTIPEIYMVLYRDIHSLFYEGVDHRRSTSVNDIVTSGANAYYGHIRGLVTKDDTGFGVDFSVIHQKQTITEFPDYPTKLFNDHYIIRTHFIQVGETAHTLTNENLKRPREVTKQEWREKWSRFSPDTISLENNSKALQEKLETLKAEAGQITTQLSAAKITASEAAQKLANLEAELKELLENVPNTDAIKALLDDVSQTIKVRQEKLDDLNTQKEALSQKMKAYDVSALPNAKEKVQTALEILNRANTAYQKALSAKQAADALVDVKTAQVSALEASLKAANDHLFKVNASRQSVDENMRAIQRLKDDLVRLRAELANLTAIYDNAVANATEARDRYEALKARYDIQEALKEVEKEVEKEAEKEIVEETPTEPVEEPVEETPTEPVEEPVEETPNEPVEEKPTELGEEMPTQSSEETPEEQKLQLVVSTNDKKEPTDQKEEPVYMTRREYKESLKKSKLPATGQGGLMAMISAGIMTTGLGLGLIKKKND